MDTRVLSIDVGKLNLAFCVLEQNAHTKDVVVKHVHFGGIAPTCEGIVDAFRDLVCEYDTVIIERQPGQNARMCRLQHFLEMFFHLRENCKVVVFDPRKKIAHAFSTAFWSVDVPFPKTYYQRKKASVAVVRRFLEMTGQCVNEFDDAHKKDDIADAILQGLAFMFQGDKPPFQSSKTLSL